MLMGVSELLNGMKDKPTAMTLVNLLADHPAASAEIKTRAVRLRETLIAENIQPEARDWGPDQMHRIVEDVILTLEQKNQSQ
jgi:hypothetical protein